MYRAVVRYMDDRVLLMITAAVAIAVIVLVALLNLLGQPQIPRAALLVYSMLAVIYVGAIRFLARALFGRLLDLRAPLRHPVVIYGAGSAGRQLAMALKAGAEYQPSLSSMTVPSCRIANSWAEDLCAGRIAPYRRARRH
jgi:FlaA1/EpsC-like NDP-sugar epimerase